MLLTLLQSRVTPPTVFDSRGGYGPPKKRKQREFEDEKRQREQLKGLIAQVVDGVDSKSAQVVAEQQDEAVVLVPRNAPALTIPVPPAFDAAEVAKMLSAALTEAGIRVREAKSKAAQERMRLEAEIALAKLRKRRREEEWLLLMD
jgi:hypothetical protein